MSLTTIEDPILIKKAYEMKKAGMFVSDILKKLSEESGKRITQLALWCLFNSIKEEPIQDEVSNKKKRQGQRGATPKPTCPKCGDILKRNYTREVINGKQQYVASDWICPSSTCDHIIKDLVELEDTEDEN